MHKFRLRFHWSLFPIYIGSDNGLAPSLTMMSYITDAYMNQWWLIYRRIYTSLDLNELMLE